MFSIQSKKIGGMFTSTNLGCLDWELPRRYLHISVPIGYLLHLTSLLVAVTE